MRHVFPFVLLIFFPLSVFARDAKLDSSKRAQRKGWSDGLITTESEFRKMRRNYHSTTFKVWSDKLNMLRNGMTMTEVEQILKPREIVVDRVSFGAGRIDTIILDDAYYTGIMVDPETKRMIWVVKQPIALAYDVRPDKASH